MPTSSSVQGASPPQACAARAVSVARMRQIDAAAIEAFGMPRLLLMDHAGLAVARVVRALTAASSSNLLICCGTGWNGGDGFAAARHLTEWGDVVSIALVGRRDRLREEPATFATIAERLGCPIQECQDQRGVERLGSGLAGSRLVVDALLGLGAEGEVREPMRSVIALMNRSGKPIVAVDLPSGLDGDTGSVQGIAIKASVTVTFGLPKRGCCVPEAALYVGSLVVDPIGLPRALLEPEAATR